MPAQNQTRRIDDRAAKTVQKIKAQARQAKAQALVAPVVFRAVDRSRLAAILAPLGFSVDDVIRIARPESPETMTIASLAVAPLSYLAPFSPFHEGAKVGPDEDENAAIRHQAQSAIGYGQEELWGIRYRHGGEEMTEYLWATPAAIASRYPDDYTRERRDLAGVRSLSGVSWPLLVERFGVLRPTT